jgi:hypothetical protein
MANFRPIWSHCQGTNFVQSISLKTEIGKMKKFEIKKNGEKIFVAVTQSLEFLYFVVSTWLPLRIVRPQ